MADLISRFIGVANRNPLIPKVQLWHWVAGPKDEFGVVREWAFAVPRTGIVEQASKVFKAKDGSDQVSETKVTLLESVTVTHDDAFAMADITVPGIPAPTTPANTMGQILDIKALLDPNKQPYMVELWMGRPTGQ
jgi:hypothetical protein